MSEWINKLSKTLNVFRLTDFFVLLFSKSFPSFSVKREQNGYDKVPCKCATYNVTYTSAKREADACIEKSLTSYMRSYLVPF